MYKRCLGLICVGLVAFAGERSAKKVEYERFRYTGFGIADSSRDKKIVETFNLVLISYLHGDEPQGQCRGAVGLIVRDPHFDPNKVSRGRLPSEI